MLGRKGNYSNPQQYTYLSERAIARASQTKSKQVNRGQRLHPTVNSIACRSERGKPLDLQVNTTTGKVSQLDHISVVFFLFSVSSAPVACDMANIRGRERFSTVTSVGEKTLEENCKVCWRKV